MDQCMGQTWEGVHTELGGMASAGSMSQACTGLMATKENKLVPMNTAVKKVVQKGTGHAGTFSSSTDREMQY